MQMKAHRSYFPYTIILAPSTGNCMGHAAQCAPHGPAEGAWPGAGGEGQPMPSQASNRRPSHKPATVPRRDWLSDTKGRGQPAPVLPRCLTAGVFFFSRQGRTPDHPVHKPELVFRIRKARDRWNQSSQALYHPS